jgi:hypothetical protein
MPNLVRSSDLESRLSKSKNKSSTKMQTDKASNLAKIGQHLG